MGSLAAYNSSAPATSFEDTGSKTDIYGVQSSGDKQWYSDDVIVVNYVNKVGLCNDITGILQSHDHWSILWHIDWCILKLNSLLLHVMILQVYCKAMTVDQSFGILIGVFWNLIACCYILFLLVDKHWIDL